MLGGRISIEKTSVVAWFWKLVFNSQRRGPVAWDWLCHWWDSRLVTPFGWHGVYDWVLVLFLFLGCCRSQLFIGCSRRAVAFVVTFYARASWFMPERPLIVGLSTSSHAVNIFIISIIICCRQIKGRRTSDTIWNA